MRSKIDLEPFKEGISDQFEAGVSHSGILTSLNTSREAQGLRRISDRTLRKQLLTWGLRRHQHQQLNYEMYEMISDLYSSGTQISGILSAVNARLPAPISKGTLQSHLTAWGFNTRSRQRDFSDDLVKRVHALFFTNSFSNSSILSQLHSEGYDDLNLSAIHTLNKSMA